MSAAAQPGVRLKGEPMVTIEAEFTRFADLHISNLFGVIGVYVLWDARAIARPTYIGEGNVLKRLGDHSHRGKRKFVRPVDGYVAILGEKKRNFSKDESKAVERLLLDVADDTDRLPAHNIDQGAAKVVRFFCEIEPTLRVKVTGYDPFFHPDRPKRLTHAMEIRAHRQSDSYTLEHDWRLRRLREAVARSSA